MKRLLGKVLTGDDFNTNKRICLTQIKNSDQRMNEGRRCQVNQSLIWLSLVMIPMQCYGFITKECAMKSHCLNAYFRPSIAVPGRLANGNNATNRSLISCYLIVRRPELAVRATHHVVIGCFSLTPSQIKTATRRPPPPIYPSYVLLSFSQNALPFDRLAMHWPMSVDCIWSATNLHSRQ